MMVKLNEWSFWLKWWVIEKKTLIFGIKSVMVLKKQIFRISWFIWQSIFVLIIIKFLLTWFFNSFSQEQWKQNNLSDVGLCDQTSKQLKASYFVWDFLFLEALPKSIPSLTKQEGVYRTKATDTTSNFNTPHFKGYHWCFITYSILTRKKQYVAKSLKKNNGIFQLSVYVT